MSSAPWRQSSSGLRKRPGRPSPQTLTPTTTLTQPTNTTQSYQPTAVTSSPTPAPQGLGDVVSPVNCGNFGWYNIGPAKIAGIEHSAAFPISCFNNGEKASADFVVPAGAVSLSGVVGIDDKTDNPDSSAIYTVLNPAGQPLAPSTTVAYGHDATVDVPLNGAVRVRLQVQFEMAHGGLVRACWADMQFMF